MLRINGVLNASHFSWQRASEMQLKQLTRVFALCMAVALICNTWVLDQFFDQFCLKLQSNLVICCSAIWFGLTTKPDLCHWSPPYDPCRLSNKDCETKSTNFYGCIAFNCFSVHYQYMLHKLIQAAI